MKNANLPAMAQSFSMNDQECGTAITHMQDEERFTGLTKREMFAMHAMQGILSNSGGVNPMSGTEWCNCDSSGLAQWSLECADALLAGLEK